MFSLGSNYFGFCQLSPFRRDQFSISQLFTFGINTAVINVDIRMVGWRIVVWFAECKPKVIRICHPYVGSNQESRQSYLNSQIFGHQALADCNISSLPYISFSYLNVDCRGLPTIVFNFFQISPKPDAVPAWSAKRPPFTVEFRMLIFSCEKSPWNKSFYNQIILFVYPYLLKRLLSNEFPYSIHQLE